MTPTITGTPQVGQTLAASIGDIQTPVTYQWNRAGTPISGATGSTYVPVAADAGNTLTVTVDLTSAPTSVVTTTSIPVNTAIPTISGAPQVGRTLTATNGTWTNSPASFTYQWNRAGTPIPGATASTYIPAAADVGNTLTISVTATNGSGPSTPAISQATRSVIDIIPANLTLPTISGTARVGQTLTATVGTWSHSPTSFVYKWANSHGLIPGATHLTYVPTSADVGLILEIFVVATNSGGTSAVAMSALTAAVTDIIPANSAVPTISGTAQVGQTLTATTGTWTHNPTSFTYQWNRAGTPIGGATASTYVPVAGGHREHVDGVRRRHEFRRVERALDKCGDRRRRRRRRRYPGHYGDAGYFRHSAEWADAYCDERHLDQLANEFHSPMEIGGSKRDWSRGHDGQLYRRRSGCREYAHCLSHSHERFRLQRTRY